MRRAIVLITPELLAGWFETGHELRVRCVAGLPHGTKICSVQAQVVHSCPERDAVAVIVEHEQLAEVKPGDLLPILTPTFERLDP